MSKLVYFMRPVGHIGPIKIGCSKMPQGRLEQLSIVSPLKLEIVAAVPGTHADERRLHGLFQAHWLHHEWFGASKELLALVSHVAANGELPQLPEVVPFKRTRRGMAGGSAGGPSSAPRAKRGPSARTIALSLRVAPLYEAGQSIEEIAAAEGCCKTKVYRALKTAGVKMRRQGRIYPESGVADETRAAEFRRRYLAGETLKEIGDDYGVSRERVRQILRKTAVPSLGHRKAHCKQPHPLTAEEIEAARMYERGVRPGEVLQAFPGLTVVQLNRAVRRLGIQIRPAGAWLTCPDDAKRTADVADLYQQGLSTAEIINRLPWLKHPETIYRYLKKAGVPPRTNKGRRRHASAPETQAA